MDCDNHKVHELKIQTLERRADKTEENIEKLTNNVNALAVKIATITGSINILFSLLLKYLSN